VTGYIPRWFTRPQTVSHPHTNPAVHGREKNSQHVDHKLDVLTSTPPSHPKLQWLNIYHYSGAVGWQQQGSLAYKNLNKLWQSWPIIQKPKVVIVML